MTDQPGMFQPGVPPEGTPEQFRISRVQLLNWGRYSDLEVMPVGRAGTAILGPTGAGKSQILDAIAAVVMPNPQEFNQAARDDRRGRAERTVYTYARGKTDQVLDPNRHSTTTAYIRPPGIDFVSGAAVTFADQRGHTVTAARLVWVAKDTASNDELTNTTVYACTGDDFDLQRLNELKPTRLGAAPLTHASLEKLLDPLRDLVTTSQPAMHARMRKVLSIGTSEESQRLALTLLRRAQSSKGVFSINDLFKQFVLTDPPALQRWDVALAAYREASALFDIFETARRRYDTLKDVPTLAEQFNAAHDSAEAERQLLRPTPGEDKSRIAVWHANKITGWVRRATDENRLEHSQERDKLTAAAGLAAAAGRRFNDVLDQITAAGGDRGAAIKQDLTAQQKLLHMIEGTRSGVSERLQSVGLSLPASSGDSTLLLADLAEKLTALTSERKDLDAHFLQAAGRVGTLQQQSQTAQQELARVRQRRSNIPPEADGRRANIANDLGVALTRLPYAGELLRIRPEHRDWETAITRVLSRVAADLLVAEADWRSVLRYVDANDMRGRIVLAPAQTHRPARRVPVPGTVPALIEIDPDSPYQGWLNDELVERFSYLCVAGPDDLRTSRPAGVHGAVTRAGAMTGTRGRVIKNDSSSLYTWLGSDNAALISQLSHTLEGLQREQKAAGQAADTLQNGRDRLLNQATTLRELQKTRWAELDTTECLARIAELTVQLDEAAAAQPGINQLIKNRDRYHQEQVTAESDTHAREQRLKTLQTEWADLCDIEDAANDLLGKNATLTEIEQTHLASIGFQQPAGAKHVGGALTSAIQQVQEQIEQHDKDAATLQRHLETIFAHYQQLDDKADIDATIDSLPTVLAIHQALVTDDLPRARKAWLAKVGDDLNDSLRKLLVQIDDDAKSIRRGIHPINEVLAGVEFRAGSVLAIDPVEHPTSELRDFRKTMTRYTSHSLNRDASDIETTFAALRAELARLEGQSRAADSWRRRVFDAREHVEFRAIETRPDGTQLVHEGVAGMSGGEGQELIAFILGAALRYRLGDGTTRIPTYAPIVLDEGFVKADAEYTGRALAALRALGFQLIIGAPREKVTAFEDHVETVAYISGDPDRPNSVRIYPLTIQEAVELERRGLPLSVPA